MKQFLAIAFVAAAALIGVTQESQASHGGKFRRCSGGCETACAAAPCATVVAAPVEVKYEDRKVTVYKQVTKEKMVDVLECKRVMREEKYQYTVCVPVTRDEKRKVVVCTPVNREVDYTYTVMVPKTVTKKIQCTTYQCVRENIVEQVPVCKTVCVTCVDECGRCHTRRERVTVMEERTRCVVKRIPIVEERTVNVTVCEPVLHKGKRTVCEIVRSEQDVVVKVCSYETQKREGVRTVCEVVTEKVQRKVSYCETVAEVTTVRVAVGGACDSSCGSDCGSSHGRRHGGIFRRTSGGCCN